MESFWAHFKGENVSLFLEAATFEELEWVIGRQMGYYNNERRHSRLEYRSPMEYLTSEGFIPKRLAKIGRESGSVSGAQAPSRHAFERLRDAAEQHGEAIYKELVQAHQERLAREREKCEYAFAARRRAIERIGLPQVRNYRPKLLEQEERRFREELESRARVLPEMVPLLIVRVEAETR